MRYKQVSQKEAQIRCTYKRALRKAGVEFDIQEPTEKLLERVTKGNIPQ